MVRVRNPNGQYASSLSPAPSQKAKTMPPPPRKPKANAKAKAKGGGACRTLVFDATPEQILRQQQLRLLSLRSIVYVARAKANKKANEKAKAMAKAKKKDPMGKPGDYGAPIADIQTNDLPYRVLPDTPDATWYGAPSVPILPYRVLPAASIPREKETESLVKNPAGDDDSDYKKCDTCEKWISREHRHCNRGPCRTPVSVSNSVGPPRLACTERVKEQIMDLRAEFVRRRGLMMQYGAYTSFVETLTPREKQIIGLLNC